MPPSAYPGLTTIRPDYFEELQPTYAVSRSPQFADGGCDFNLDADQAVRRWRIEYTSLSETEADTLDAHASSAKYADEVGSAYGFTLTTESGEVVPNVRYDRGGYKRSLVKAWIKDRSVMLVKYP